MKLEEIKTEIPEVVFERLNRNISELNPPQEQAVKLGLFKKNNLIVSSPTASGKTLIATLAASKTLKEKKGKILYVVPLKALANEKYHYYTNLFKGLFSVAISTGDFDSNENKLYDKDFIIITVEKLDSLLRHNAAWISKVKLVVADEIHLLNDVERGPTLEIALTRLKELIEFQFIGLSATIKNSEELSSWLNCQLVESNYRPVELEEGILCQGLLEFYNKKRNLEFVNGSELANIGNTIHLEQKYNSDILDLAYNTLKKSQQAIIFVKSRRSAESLAKKISVLSKQFLDKNTLHKLKKISNEAENVLENPTAQCKHLGLYLKSAVAFHHAGLLNEQKRIIEENFRKGLIKIIVATPTLAMGVSLPSYRVIIQDLKRYSNFGLQYIPVLEYKQFAGRAGRPEHHSKGEAISIAKDSRTKEEIKKRYVFGEVENIYSKLAVEPILRTHVLSLIATHSIASELELMDFFSKTFYAYQYKDLSIVENHINSIVKKLQKYGFVKKENGLEATLIGKRVSELYIDPDTAYYFISSLEKVKTNHIDELGLLKLMCDSLEMRPLLNVKKSDYSVLEDILEQFSDKLLGNIPQEWDYDYDSFLRSLKTALVMYNWINEVGEDKIMEKFGLSPGGLRVKLEILNWLLYSCREFCILKKWKNLYRQIEKLRLRLKYGIKDELFPLIKLKGIGRVRARMLFNNKIKSLQDIREIPFNNLKNLIGKQTALNLKKAVGENVFDRENILNYFKNSKKA